MIKKHIITLPHHPKRVTIVSLILAIIIGIFGYTQINKKVENLDKKDQVNNNTTVENPNTSNTLSLGFLASGRIKTVSVKAGDIVKKGDVLATLDAGNAAGALTQAKAAYASSKANYQKIINGATGPSIEVAKAAVHTAQVNLDGVTKQQNLLVANAFTNLLNSNIVATLLKSDTSMTPPSITGTYNKTTQGNITFTVNQAGNGGYINFDGIETGTASASTTSPQAIGTTGLYIEFTSINPYVGTTWVINIPNKSGANYLTNNNAYQNALQTMNQSISNAQATLDQANASLSALVATVRPEDLAIAQAQMDNALGAVQIAEAAYNNTIIVAPSDGMVSSVAIAPGQIAAINTPAIEFISSNN